MKKIGTKLLFSSVMLLSVVGMSACGSSDSGEEVYGKETREIVAQAEKLDRAALFEKAANEVQDGTFKFIGTSSRFKKAIDGFKSELSKYNSKCANMTITTDTAVDGQIYTTLLGEIDNNVEGGYSAALVQDGYQLSVKALKKNKFVNYIPKEWQDATDTNKELNAEPFSLQYNFKTWMLNDNGTGKTVDNVWDFTTSDFKGKICTMDPNNENVNMDFLVMLTKDSWCDVLKEAFDDSSNDNKSLDLTAYEKYGEKKKYAYAFIAKFLENSAQYGDDGKARDQLIAKNDSAYGGWIVYSKIASVQETNDISVKNITICALGDDNTDGKTATMHMKGFGGFMYKHYLQIMPNATHPWTACAFINYLSTTKEGYKGWASDIGDYPSMPSINVDRTKYGHGTVDESGTFHQDDNAENYYPAFNDPTSSWWEDSAKGNCVIEDPSYIGENYSSVYKFIHELNNK